MRCLHRKIGEQGNPDLPQRGMTCDESPTSGDRLLRIGAGCLRGVSLRHAAPVYRGRPGYREGMDGDSDGIACEPYRGMRGIRVPRRIRW
jgi:hypothetical protein